MDPARQPLGAPAVNWANPSLVWLVLALPGAALAAVLLWGRRRRRAAALLGEAPLLRRLGAGELGRAPLRRQVLIVAAAAALGVAAAGPRWGLREVEQRSRALDLVVALDVSRSMLVADVQPDRLERARLLARRLLRELPGDRIGMVAFAGRAYVLTPPTVDHSALQLYLDALDPEIVSQGGSSLSAAIRQATDLVRGEGTRAGERAVVVVTDGEALEEAQQVREAAARAAELGVVVHTVGVGTAAGGRIPVRDPRTGAVQGYQRDLAGEVVVSTLHEDLLREVADLTGGRYVSLAESGSIATLVAGLRGMERAEGPGGRRVEPRERYAWFVALALLLLGVDAVLESGGRGRGRRAPRVEEGVS